MSTTRKRRNKTSNKHDNAVIQPKPIPHSYPLSVVLIIGVIAIAFISYMLVTLLYSTQPTSITVSDLPLPSAPLIERAQTYSYTGDADALEQLIRGHGEVDWVGLQQSSLGGPSTNTLIHIALHGRQESVSSSLLTLNGNHERIIEYLVYDVGWNASYGCPVYFALHYKNLKALKVLLSSTSSLNNSLYCVTTTDTMGLTALHVAAKSKASGFARFYSKLFDSSGLVNLPQMQTIASILGISHKAPVQPVPGTLSLNALNDVVLDEDISLILNKLSVNNVKLSEILDSFNNTVTHIAAYAGRKRLVETLLRYIKATDDDNHMENAFGQSPQLLAELGGFNDIARLFGNPLPSVREEFVRINKSLVNEFQHINWKKYKRSGWTVKSESLNVLKESYPLCSEVLPVIQELTHQSMSHRTPLLIHSDEILDWKAWSKWRKKDILNRYGQMMINVASIPYEDTYLANTRTTATVLTLEEYINSFNSTLHSRPLYLFDGRILDQLPQLMDDIVMPQWLNPSAVYLKQFILGGRDSGSPPHFHDHAVNILVYGAKEWFFWSPSTSFFTFTHVSDWRKKHYHNHSPPSIHCVQLPGDVVYVPQYWGHAVINIEESIGVALEFW